MIQLQCLNYILDKRDSSFFILNNLTQEHFSDYPEEFKYIKEHYLKYGNVPDKDSFLTKFDSFQCITVSETPKFLIDELSKDLKNRTMINSLNSMRQSLMNGDIETASKIYMDGIDKLTQSTTMESIDIFKDSSRFDDYVERSNDFKKYYVKTGFNELDIALGCNGIAAGWDRNEELATIIARPGVGKTWVLLKTAVAAASAGLTVGIYSGEMSVNKVAYRIDTLISGISNYAISKGRSDVESEYKSFIKRLNAGEMSGTIKVLTPSMINGPAGVTALRAFIEKENLDMLCIDQHSLLEDDRKGKTPVEKASNISKDLKNLQVMKKIPIIAVSQQNRMQREDGVVDVANIAQADRIGQDSTAVIAVDQKVIESDGRKKVVMTLTLVKSRDSATGAKLEYIVDLDKGSFTYKSADGDATGGMEVEENQNKYVSNISKIESNETSLF